MRRPLVPLALVAGALAPDVPYFLRALRIPVSAQDWWEPFLNATTTHGWPGAVTTALPTAFVLYLALASAVRPARWMLSSGSSAKAGPRSPRPMQLVWVTLSLGIGLLTHLAWDSFTDSNGWIVQNLDLLHAGGLGSLTWARLLQHASTLLGLSVLIVIAWRKGGRWLAAAGSARRIRLLRVMTVVLVSAIAAMLAVASLRYEAGTGVELLLSSAAIGAGIGVAVSTACLSVLWWLVRPDKPRTA